MNIINPITLEHAINEAGLRLERKENNSINAHCLPVAALAECLTRAIAPQLKNDVICQEDVLSVLLPARMIPHDATVTRRAGNPDVEYTLKHKLTMYGIPPEGSKIPAPPTIVDGFFVIGRLGTIHQVKPETLLHWRVTADSLVDVLMRSWESRDHQ
jgi:hypothetical protein